MARTYHRKGKSGKPGPLTVVHPDCAGIDIGSREHWVAIDPARCAEPVRRFEAFTDGLEALADWLTQTHITTVAMEATGVYWIPLFELLDRRGFEVYLCWRRPGIEPARRRPSDPSIAATTSAVTRIWITLSRLTCISAPAPILDHFSVGANNLRRNYGFMAMTS